MFLFRMSNFVALQSLYAQIQERAKIRPLPIIFMSSMILVAHYFGFIWALTNFKPFYADWLFFLNLSLGFVFAIALSGLVMMLILSLINFADLLISALIPDRVMRVEKILRFRVPILQVRLLRDTLLAVLFLLILLITYTSLNWWQIPFYLLLIPATVALWTSIVYLVIRRNQMTSFDLALDLGEKYELSADALLQIGRAIEHYQLEIESYISEHLPPQLRVHFENLMRQIHHVGDLIGEAVPDKEKIHAEITDLQVRVAELSWNYNYIRFALPKIRGLLIGVLLILSIVTGYYHVRDFVNHRQVEMVLQSGEVQLVTPISLGSRWQVLYADGQIFSQNADEVASFRTMMTSDDAD